MIYNLPLSIQVQPIISVPIWGVGSLSKEVYNYILCGFGGVESFWAIKLPNYCWKLLYVEEM